MIVKGMIAAVTLAGVFAIAMQANDAAALFCTPLVPTTNSNCTNGSTLAGTGTVSKDDAAGTKWTYSVALNEGASVSGRLVANDGTTLIKNIGGFNCPTAVDQTDNLAKGADQKCTTAANAPKKYRIVL